ncbi:MAG: site-specific integrase [Desemzia incerta]|uniref:site-specific integrase n=1 Tax=Desemzia incerta TaxID=82801 RepID=UPI0033147AF0
MLIREAIEDFELNQVVLSRAENYINKCMCILDLFERYMKEEFDIAHVEDFKSVHIRNLIKYWQELSNERNSTLNNNLATIKVFYKYLTEEEYIELDKVSTRNIRNLKEEKIIIKIFNNTEVRGIVRD